jgi:hypothetical protein
LKYSNQIFQDEADHSSSFFLLSFILTQAKLNTQLFQTTSIRQRRIVQARTNMHKSALGFLKKASKIQTTTMAAILTPRWRRAAM